MNIILLEPGDWIDPNTVRLNDYRHRHMTEVLKVTLGQTLRVGLVNGDWGIGTVSQVEQDATRLTVELQEGQRLPRHPMKVILALPRPKMLRRVLRTCAEFGVGELHLIHSYRVEKSFWQTPLLDDERITEALRAGMERSGDPIMPKVYKHKRFKPFMEDTLPVIAGSGHIYCLHPGKSQPLTERPAGNAAVLLGPEGGFIPYEVQLAQAQGAVLRTLGDRILSVDTAVNAALAQTL